MPTINSLLIKPAGPDCNIACRYCFYSGKKELFAAENRHRMTAETLRRTLTDYLTNAPDAAAIGFQGGEPTLCGYDFFEEALRVIRETRRPGQHVDISLQTNGLLLDERWAKLLRENHVLVGLSMDGPEALHDAYRRGFDDSPTHSRVAEKMELLRRERVEFNNLCVVTRTNVGHARELYEYFRDHGSGFMQFIPCVEVVGGKLEPYSLTPEEYGKFLIEAFDLWYNGGFPECYVRMFDEMLISFVEYRSPSCYFSKNCVANLVVEHDGSIYPCDFFVEPGWRLGNIHERSLREIAADPLLERFIARKAVINEECSGCRWRSICCGDCCKYRMDENGAPADRAYFCEGYKAFFEHAAPLLRELKRKLYEQGTHPRAPYWRSLEASLTRNSPCPCGSGEKFKKCCQGIKSI